MTKETLLSLFFLRVSIMKKYRVVTQKTPGGCGVACLASLLGKSFETVLLELIEMTGRSNLGKFGIKIEDIKKYLSKKGIYYSRRKPTPLNLENIPIGSIALVKYTVSDTLYKDTHYLLKCPRGWMESWGNFRMNNPTKAFYRKRLNLNWKIMYLINN